MSPTSEDASKIEGEVKTKVATPEEPSRERVSETSGTEGSTTPLINWREVASTAVVEGRAGRREGRGATGVWFFGIRGGGRGVEKKERREKREERRERSTAAFRARGDVALIGGGSAFFSFHSKAVAFRPHYEARQCVFCRQMTETARKTP